MIQVLELIPKVCDVCRLVDQDVSEKPCAYCGLCDSWICSDDLYKWGRRARAALKRHLEPAYKGTTDLKMIFTGDPEAEKVIADADHKLD